ncbi:MAG: hypothetical protein N4A72_18815 [Bacteroidales bacterium]|nr:hypothetical protein [Bacteroidales bacterium]
MNRLIITALILTLLISCEKDSKSTTENEDTTTEQTDSDSDSDDGYYPTEHPDDSIDFNGDNIKDFIITYYHMGTYDVPSSGGRIFGSIRNIGENGILYKVYKGSLTLKWNDTLKRTYAKYDSLGWSTFRSELVSIKRTYSKWDTIWKAMSTEQQNYYTVGYKIKLDNSDIIGWKTMKFDKKTGKIYFSDGDLTAEDELIIKESAGK